METKPVENGLNKSVKIKEDGFWYKIRNWIYKQLPLVLLVTLLLGVGLGFGMSKGYFAYKITEATRLGNFINPVDDKIYEVKERIR